MRALENPTHRLPLRADFPDAFRLEEVTTDILNALYNEIAKIGIPAKDACVTVAVPHKHPNKNGRPEARQYARNLAWTMGQQTTGMHWQVANGLIETQELERKEGWHSYRFDSKQHYTYLPELDAKPISFGNDSLFVIVDDSIEYGSTVADMASFITHNGGHVLFAAAYTVHKPRIVLRRDGEACPITQLGDAFVTAARNCEWSIAPQAAIDGLDKSLRTNGFSLDSLTYSEYQKLHASFAEAYTRRDFLDTAGAFGLKPSGFNRFLPFDPKTSPRMEIVTLDF